MGFLKCCSPNNNSNESENYPGEVAAVSFWNVKLNQQI